VPPKTEEVRHPGKKQGQELYCGAKAAPPASDVGGLGGERSKNPDANGGTRGTRLRSERRQLPPARFEWLRAAHCHRRRRPSRADSSPGNRDSSSGLILVIAAASSRCPGRCTRPTPRVLSLSPSGTRVQRCAVSFVLVDPLVCCPAARAHKSAGTPPATHSSADGRRCRGLFLWKQ
jgi:hypothetical protein